MLERIYMGVDLGGTSIKTGLCDQEGQLLEVLETLTEADAGTETVLNNIAACARRIIEESSYSWEQVIGIGAGIPGFMDFEEGFMHFSPNLPLTNVPIKRILEEKLGKTVIINNDANVAALGEAWSGAGKDVKILVCYTLGTGVGGAIIIHGHILQGSSGMGGELGHMSIVPDLEAIQCGCGQMGCLETVASATGIIRMANDAVERGDHTILMELPHITAKDVFDAAKAGDETADRIVKRAAFYLGKSMAAAAVIVNPNRFVIGGGVSHAGDILLKPVQEVFQKFAQAKARENVDIVIAKLGNNAGVIGAAGLCLRS
jgi:glucokinase